MSSETSGSDHDSHYHLDFDPDIKWPEINQVYLAALEHPVDD